MIAIFSDIHGNLPALEQFVRVTRDLADAYICLGDVVNYGPWSNECVDLVDSLPQIILLEGNHERLFLGLDPLSHEIPLVQQFTHHVLPHFARFDRIKDLALEHRLGDYRCIHTIDGQRVYRDTAIEIADNYIIGHTHHQFRIERSGKTIVNCGSVGQNRAFIDVLSYILFDPATGQITLCEAQYDFDRFLDEMSARHYPQPCIDYYASKKRRKA
jgi:predicted phosphodiesterase